jgi:signal transduction histidine kinase
MAWRSIFRRRPFGLRWVAPVAAALAVLLVVTNELGVRAVERATAQREAVVGARAAVGQLRRDLLLMESAQRGFLLTARPEYREPYDRTRRALGESVAAVRALAQADPAQRVALDRLADAAERRASEMGEVLRLVEKGERAQGMELLLTDIGREEMERVNQLVDGLLAASERAYAASGDLRERVQLWSRVALVLLVVACLVAVRAAIGLDRARALERARHLRELGSERDKLEAEVERRTAELTDLARHLQTVREDERSRLARELHDELGGLLTAAKLDLARVRKRLAGGPPETLERVQHLGETLDAGIALKRRIIEDLRPSALANLGLQRTLEILCTEFAQRADLPVRTELDAVPLDGERALAVYRLVQEALTNVAKYAQARQVHVRLHADGRRATVSVVDDGVGFDPQRLRPGSHGLAGMRFRVISCGGDWLLRSAPGAGTTVQASVPL